MERAHFPGHNYLFKTFEKQVTNGQVSINPKEKIRYGHLGEAFHDTSQTTFQIQQSTGQKIITVLHELLHLKYPHINEDDIEQQAINIYRKLALAQLGFFEFLVET